MIYEYADAAVLHDPPDAKQHCAVCGEIIWLRPGEAMTFDTRPSDDPRGFDILTLHIECDTRNNNEDV